jgi:hypothetical protein
MKKRTDYIEISKTILEELYYGQGLKQREIALQFGVSAKTIGNRMAEYGMTTRSHDDYLYIDIPKSELERLYIIENRTTPEIAKIYGCAISLIYNRLKEHGIPIKPGGWDKVKQIVPTERLEWSPAFAYIVGLIASDGNLQSNNNEVRLTSTDREIVEYYCLGLGLRPHDIPATAWREPNAVEVHMRIENRPPYKVQYHIIFSDYIYRARLEAIGLTSNKSNTLGSLQIPDEYFRDFLRGEFDGDGCWSTGRQVKLKHLLGILTSGSRTYLEWMKETIKRLAGIEAGYISGIDLRYQGKSAEQLGNFIYYAPQLPCLIRKRAKWEMWVTEKRMGSA